MSAFRIGTLAARSILERTLGSWKGKLILVASAVAYWVLYSFSAGVIFYYSFDLAPLLKSAGVPNHYYVIYTTGGLMGVYYSGMVWFPTNHLQLNLLFGPTFFSVLLSLLFGLNMVLLGYSLSVKAKSARGINGLVGVAPAGLNGLVGILNSFVGIIPALFSGGCCALPLGTIILSSLFPLSPGPSALSRLEFNYAPLIDSLLAGLMLFVLVHSAKKLEGCCAVTTHG